MRDIPNKSAMDGEVQSDIGMQDISHLPDGAFLNEGVMKRTLMMRDIFRDYVSCKHYTGLSLLMFTFLLNLLREKAEKMTYWRSSETAEINGRQTPRRGPKRMLSLKEELAVTLTRLRRGIDTVTLGNMFGISEASLSRIVITWVSLIAAELKYLIRWPSREQISHKLPACFKHYPKTRSIIDCTEIFVQKPSLPSAQRVTFSQYKHHNTFKCLVSITPTGTFSFISELYSGSISDKRIVVDSNFLDKVERGDDIMADRGFLIRGELALRGATLNIPPFSNGKQLCPQAVTKTRRIAHARIHVERAIGRLKNFEILQKTDLA
ncbi:uncharacterized protein LOC117319639 isoform X2 [Pecten maximus]|uniref:uncharacterized protein LOC117319639 isoform X2 n=1 Tax=Pecten maximus TaxID=6579 RepID=UPI001458F81D|nr:uncharacterized protein LOC117319639 isoform X2 [Pecten maximus]